MNRTAEALCAALRVGPAGRGQLDLTGLTPAEWHDVATLAIRQRVGPLLYSRKHLPFPDDARAVLRARAEVSARRVLMQQAAFRELAAAVAPHGVTLMALKGLHLSTSVYPSAGLREMNDIDVMVQPEQVETVAGVMTTMGFTQLKHVDVSIALAKLHHLPRFFRGPVGVELHWKLAPPGRAPFTDHGLWSRAEANPLAPNTKSLGAEDALLHLCAHAAESHQLEQGLRTLCDVNALVARSGDTLDWTAVVERSRSWKCERALGLVLGLAYDHLGLRIPAWVLTQLDDALPPANVRALAIDQVFDNQSGAATISEAAGRWVTLPFGERLSLAANRVRMTAADSDPAANTRPGLPARAGFQARRITYLLRHYVPRLFAVTVQREGAVRKALDRRNALVAWLRER